MHEIHYEKELKNFEEYLKIKKYTLKSQKTFMQNITLFLKWLVQEEKIYQINKINALTIQKYHNHIAQNKLSKNTIYLKIRSIQKFFKNLEQNNILLYNLAQTIQLPEKNSKIAPSILTLEEIKKLRGMPGTSKPLGIRNKALIELLCSTGIKTEEYESLEITDIHYTNSHLQLKKKKGKERLVPLNYRASKHLKKYTTTLRPKLLKNIDEQALFLTLFGKKFNKDNVNKLLKKYQTKAKINKRICIQTLRNSFIANSLKQGKSLVYVQRVSGFTNVKSLEKYKLKKKKVSLIDRIEASFKKEIIEYIDAIKEKNYSNSTIQNNLLILKNLSKWLKSQNTNNLKKVTLKILNKYHQHIKKKGLKTSTIITHLSLIKAFFQFLEKSRMILFNPAEKIIIPENEKRLPVNALTEAEMEKILNAPDISTNLGLRNRALLELLYSTGIRRQECQNLKLHDVDYKNGLLRINQGKGKKDRIVPLGQKASLYVKTYVSKIRPQYIKEKEEALFLSNKKHKLTSYGLHQVIKACQKKAGIKKTVNTHTIRRTFATHLLKNEAHPLLIQKMLGHTTGHTLKKYIKITAHDIKKSHKKYHPRERNKK